MIRPMHKLALLLAATAITLALFTACGAAGTCDGASCSTGTGGLDAGKDGSGGSGGKDEGTFPCKLMTCNFGTDACEVTTHLGQNPVGQCIPLPTACGAANGVRPTQAT